MSSRWRYMCAMGVAAILAAVARGGVGFSEPSAWPPAEREHAECLRRRGEHVTLADRLRTYGTLHTVVRRGAVSIDCLPPALACGDDCSVHQHRSGRAAGAVHWWHRPVAGTLARVDAPRLDADTAHLNATTDGRFNLHMRNVEPTATGFYLCKRTYFGEDEALNVAFVDVLGSDHVDFEKSAAKASVVHVDEKKLSDDRLKLSVEWTSWTPCDRCHRGDNATNETAVGEQRRATRCFVQSKVDVDTLPLALRWLMNIFHPEQIPCRTSLLPVKLRRATKNYKALIQWRPCMVPCGNGSEPGRRYIKDAQGKLVDVIEGNEYSLTDDLPLLPMGVLRSTHLRLVGERAVFPCGPWSGGGAERWGGQEPAFYWRKVVERGFTTHSDEAIGNEALSGRQSTRGRVLVDEHFSLHFHTVHRADEALYNCFDRSGVLLSSDELIIKDYHWAHVAKLYINTLTGFAVVILIVVLFVRKGFQLSGRKVKVKRAKRASERIERAKR